LRQLAARGGQSVWVAARDGDAGACCVEQLRSGAPDPRRPPVMSAVFPTISAILSMLMTSSFL
jgi:hypothetical protein